MTHPSEASDAFLGNPRLNPAIEFVPYLSWIFPEQYYIQPT